MVWSLPYPLLPQAITLGLPRSCVESQVHVASAPSSCFTRCNTSVLKRARILGGNPFAAIPRNKSRSPGKHIRPNSPFCGGVFHTETAHSSHPIPSHPIHESSYVNIQLAAGRKKRKEKKDRAGTKVLSFSFSFFFLTTNLSDRSPSPLLPQPKKPKILGKPFKKLGIFSKT